MGVEWVRQHCLSFPNVTETVQWGDDLVFKIGGKMFAVGALSPGKTFLAFKASPENFAELTDRPGMIPAPYLARAHWVALETEGALPRAEAKALLREAYQLVLASLPKKTQAELATPAAPARKSPAKQSKPASVSGRRR